jgi:hypothetical protein
LGQAVAQEPGNMEIKEKSLYPALLGGLFTNTAFHLTSRVFGADFAQTTPESIKTNFTGNIGAEIIYGNPFTANSKIPYSQFEIEMQLGVSPRPFWLDWTILTDGYLVSFSPIDTEKDILSTGLSMQYDLIAGNNTNFASNALDWSIKWKHIFTNINIELKAHTGWTFFGSSQYYPFAEITGEKLELHEADNDYGIGGNAKISFTIQTKRHGKLTIGAYNYLLYIIPWNKPDSRGIEFFNLSYFKYSYPFEAVPKPWSKDN